MLSNTCFMASGVVASLYSKTSAQSTPKTKRGIDALSSRVMRAVKGRLASGVWCKDGPVGPVKWESKAAGG
jgi:hypothetical protein